MRCSCANPSRPFPWIRLALIAILMLLSSGWTCAVFFVSCQGVAQPQITSLSPEAISNQAESVLLTVAGNGFTPQSQIMWNSNALPTALTDSQHLQTTITQQTFKFFGGSPGSSVQISAKSQGNLADPGCPIDGNSNVLFLAIN